MDATNVFLCLIILWTIVCIKECNALYFCFDDKQDKENFIPVCPYYQELYRQFPGPQIPGGKIGPPGIGPGFGPPPGAPPFFDDMDMDEDFGPPSGPPPSAAPSKAQAGGKAVDLGSLRCCRFRYVYVWLNSGRSFWMYLVFVGRRSIAGWRWTGRRWVYFGIDTRRIVSFICY